MDISINNCYWTFFFLICSLYSRLGVHYHWKQCASVFIMQLTFHGVVHTCIFMWSGHCQCFLKTTYVCVCILYTHIFVYSNISEAIFMNYRVYRKKIYHLMHKYVCIYTSVEMQNLLKMIYPAMWFDIKLQQLFGACDLYYKHKWLALVCKWKTS